MGILDFDPSAISLDVGGITSQVVVWGSLILWLVAALLIMVYFLKWKQYKIPITLYEKIGGAIVQTKRTMAKEINKDGTTKYEIRTLFGMVSRKNKEFYFNPDSEYKIPTKKGKGFGFNLLKIGFNAYNPIRMKVYTNTFDKIMESLRSGIGRKAEFNPKKPHEEKDIYMKTERNTYVPIKFDEVCEYEIIPQNLLPHLARSLQENQEMFNQEKWWMPYLFPFSIFIFCILQLFVMGWMFEKVGSVGGACAQAESKITDVLSQRIS